MSRKNPPAEAKLTLGLDVGPNSVGWALIKKEPGGGESLLDLGARIFTEGVDNFDTSKEVSRTEGRRIARGMRRQIARRRRRLRILRGALVEIGLFPQDPTQEAAVLALNPYELRARALTEKLKPFEVGRIFLHLGKRRGFLSNRRKDRKDGELKGVLAEINQLEDERVNAGVPTLGVLLYQKEQAFSHARRSDNDQIRNRHTARAMYEAEFEKIWAAQAEFGHEIMLSELNKFGERGKQHFPCRPRRRIGGRSPLKEFGIHGIVFFQRKMYWPRSMVGLCKLEPRLPRCPIADRHAQRFRLLQEVNNLRYVDPDMRLEASLTRQQREKLIAHLSTREQMTFDQIRKLLGFTESVRFNLERGKRPKIQGHETDALMAKAMGKEWHHRTESDKNEIVRAILDPNLDDDEFQSFAERRLGLSADEAIAAGNVDFRRGYSHLSLRAIDRLMPHLERGLVYQSESDPEISALHAAGYLRRDELKRRIFDFVPNPERGSGKSLSDIPNPVVKRAFSELRKVVNAVIRKYGKPDAIHVEMGRDMKTRPKPGTKAFQQYQDKLEEQREREARRNSAVEILRDNNIRVTRDNILKYILWQQQLESCVYSGRPIAFSQLYGDDIEIDHILPWSRSLDDSQMNKVVCFRHAPSRLGNHDKKDRTPYEWLGEQRPNDYDAVCQRARKLPYPKYRRFLLKELKLDEFIERQLNDTRYIAKLAGEYLRCIVEKDHDVLGLKGGLTAELRHQWGLDTVLAQIPDSPAWHHESQLTAGEKNRADHRHHAIDAIIVALTDRSRLNSATGIWRAGGVAARGDAVAEPWPRFRETIIHAIEAIKISRRVERKVSGALHEETLYGKTPTPGEWVVRKPIELLSPNEIDRIRDSTIRSIIVARLKLHGVEFGRGKKPDAKKWKQALSNVFMPSGVPILKVRIIKPELTIEPIRVGSPGTAFVKPGSIHHICIFEFGDGKTTKREPVFVSMLAASTRLKEGLPIISRTHPERPDGRFIMSLSRGEYVLAGWKGEEKLLAFRTAASTQGQLYFVEHTDARKSDEAKKYVFTANTLSARKVTVDPLGRIRWAND